VALDQQLIIHIYGNGNAYQYLGTSFSLNTRTVSTVKSAEIADDRMSHLIPRGRYFDIVMNV
jgi:hypothetical protein